MRVFGQVAVLARTSAQQTNVAQQKTAIVSLTRDKKKKQIQQEDLEPGTA
jgi:hypothetical protein